MAVSAAEKSRPDEQRNSHHGEIPRAHTARPNNPGGLGRGRLQLVAEGGVGGGERQVVDHGSGADSGNALEALGQLLEIGHLLGFGIELLGPVQGGADGHFHGEDVVGMDAQIGLLEADQAAHHEAGAGEQKEGEGGLAGNQEGKQAGGTFGRAGRRPLRKAVCKSSFEATKTGTTLKRQADNRQTAALKARTRRVTVTCWR